MSTAELDAAIVQLRSDLTAAQSELSAAQANLASWQASLQNAYANNADTTEIAANNAKIAENQTRVSNARSRVDSIQAELDNKLKYRDALEAAAAAAISRGVSPEQAYALAEAEVLAQQRKTKLVNTAVIVGAIILVLVVAMWAWRKYNRK